MEVVYCFIGRLPSYIVETVYQTRLFFTGQIVLLCDDLQSPHLEALHQWNVKIVPLTEVTHPEFEECKQRNREKFCVADHLGDRKDLFLLSFQRFFNLECYMKKFSVQNVLFLELDIMIYKNPEELLPIFQQKELTLSYVCSTLISSAYLYVREASSLTKLTQAFLNFIETSVGKNNDRMSEMNALTQWLTIPENKASVWMLPGIWKDAQFPVDTYSSCEAFQNVLFDGLAIAIRVDGPDASHRAEWERRGKVWWGADVAYEPYPYEWRKDSQGRRILHLVSQDGKSYPVASLHVHNKNLSAFLSKSFPRPPLHPFVNGDQFLLLADAVLRTKTRSDYYPVKGWDSSSCIFFEDLSGSWQNPSLLFCNTEDLKYLRTVLPFFQNRFVLLSHNADTNITSEFLWLTECPLLSHWFTQNLCEPLPKTSFLPIGVANPTWSHGTPELFLALRSQLPPKELFVYTAFRTSTNPSKRDACKAALEELGVPLFPIVDPLQNLVRTAVSYFTVCPEGNGIDTHRFWEALLVKSIPIVLRSPFTEHLKAAGYPCILLEKWSDLHPGLLVYTPEVFTPDLEEKLQFSWFKSKIEKEVKATRQTPSWALTLVANAFYFQRAVETIRDARTQGTWRDAIVLFLPEDLFNEPVVKDIATYFQVELVVLPDRDVSLLFSKWNRLADTPEFTAVAADFEYARARPFIYMKFYTFSAVLRKYDFLFYLDAGCKIKGDLNRFKTVCTDTSCVYAHSDAYPTYEWKLRSQFFLQSIPKDERTLFELNYPMDTDYFQSTLMIFHKNIIQDTTVEDLFELALQSPISRRMDQGIFNLHFLCQKKIWKQIPFRDEIGFLYDYHPRPGHTASEYCVLKTG